MQLCSWQLFHSNSFRVSNTNLKTGGSKIRRTNIPFRHKYFIGGVVRGRTCDATCHGLNNRHLWRQSCVAAQWCLVWSPEIFFLQFFCFFPLFFCFSPYFLAQICNFWTTIYRDGTKCNRLYKLISRDGFPATSTNPIFRGENRLCKSMICRDGIKRGGRPSHFCKGNLAASKEPSCSSDWQVGPKENEGYGMRGSPQIKSWSSWSCSKENTLPRYKVSSS